MQNVLSARHVYVEGLTDEINSSPFIQFSLLLTRVVKQDTVCRGRVWVLQKEQNQLYRIEKGLEELVVKRSRYGGMLLIINCWTKKVLNVRPYRQTRNQI
jgi:hypothetical protein